MPFVLCEVLLAVMAVAMRFGEVDTMLEVGEVWEIREFCEGCKVWETLEVGEIGEVCEVAEEEVDGEAIDIVPVCK